METRSHSPAFLVSFGTGVVRSFGTGDCYTRQASPENVTHEGKLFPTRWTENVSGAEYRQTHCMQKQQLLLGENKPPAYPFSGRELFSDVRARLSKHMPFRLSLERLARMIGLSRSTTHHWFEIFEHPHVISFMCLLERLPELERQDFIAAHCRVLASLGHPTLGHSPATVGKLQELLLHRQALTFIFGGDEWSRRFVASALGRWVEDRATPQQVCGIDLHRPRDLVPLSNVRYIDPSRFSSIQMKRVIGDLLPKLATSSRKLMLFDQVWSTVPEVRHMLLRCCQRNHVIVCEAGAPDVRSLKRGVAARITLLRLEQSKQKKGLIRVLVRIVRGRKKQAMVQ